MGNTKTLAEPQHEAPVVAHEAKAPEKVPGPQREKSSAAHSTPPNDARFFDPKRYRIILFDQRGCGN